MKLEHEHIAATRRVLTFPSHSRAIEKCACGHIRTLEHAWDGQPRSPEDDTWTAWRSPTPSADSDS